MPPAPTRSLPASRRVLAATALALAVLGLHAVLLGGLPLGPEGPAPAAAPRPLQLRQLVLPPSRPVPAEPEADGLAMETRPVVSAAPALAARKPSLQPADRSESAEPASGADPMVDKDGTDDVDSMPAPRGEAQPPAWPDGPLPPTYATRLPPAVTLQYSVQRSGPLPLPARGPAAAGLQAQLMWRPEAALGRYTLSLGMGATGTASVGALDLHGLAPERHVETRRGRELRAANFQRQPVAEGGGRITFSSPRHEHPLWPGVQDRLSWMLQLAAVLAAEPGLVQPGREVLLMVVGVRGDAAPWVFRVVGTGPLPLPAGTAEAAVHLRRDRLHPYDTQVDVWLDPARHHLPARLRLQHRAEGPATEFSLLQSTF